MDVWTVFWLMVLGGPVLGVVAYFVVVEPRIRAGSRATAGRGDGPSDSDDY